MPTVRGAFDVKTLPQPAEGDAEFQHLSRLLLDKQFHGPLAATSKGEMLAMGDPSGWGVYVAIERVSGVLDGQEGSFALYHGGTRTANGQHLDIAVVPQSGTGALAGLSGTMAIEIAPDGAHSYVFDYELGGERPPGS